MANECKYQKKQYQISYDDGSTWYDAVPARYEKGSIIEYSSPDCTGIETQYRWRELEGQYICVDKDKYTKEIQEESYDNGATWYVSYPTVYREGEFVGYDEEYCSFKFKGHYLMIANPNPPTPSPSPGSRCPAGMFWNGHRCAIGRGLDPLKIVKCNNSSTLTSGETKYYISYYPIFSAEIGACAKNIGNYAFSGCTILSSVTIENGVESIGGAAFSGCTALKNIDIPDSVTNIHNMAFYQCTGLTSCTLGNSITSINNYVFDGCTSLKSIDIPDGVTSIGNYAFENCRSLTSCTLGNSVETIGTWAFYNCFSLTSIAIPDSVTSIGNWAFASCSGLTNCTIQGGSIGDGSFSGCTSLTSCTLGNSVTSIGNNAFRGCTSLTTADIQGGSIGDYAFYNCTGLTSCTLGSGVTSIGQSAFGLCTGFTNIVIPDSVTTIGREAFSSCKGLTSLTIGSGVTSIDTWAFSDCSGLTSIKIYAMTPPTLGSGAFDGSTCLIRVPEDSVAAYKAAWSRYSSRIYGMPYKWKAVYSDGHTEAPECDASSAITQYEVSSTGLVRVDIGYCVATIGDSAFVNCTSLTSIDIPDSVTSIGQSAFSGCTSLTSIDIPTGVTNIGDSTFNGCSSLTSIDIPSGVTSIGQSAFNGCSSFTGITVNAMTPPTLGSGAFDGSTCPILVPFASIDIYKAASGWSTYGSRIDGKVGKWKATYADGHKERKECDGNNSISNAEITKQNLVNVEIGDCVEVIGSSAFSSSNSLTSVTIPDSVTSIGQGALRYCRGLTSVIIPSGVTSISGWAFASCDSLESFKIYATTPPTLGNGVFDYTPCTIYVPASSLNAYKNATKWVRYSSMIQPIT